MMNRFEVRRVYDHYAVYIDGELWCTAESRREAEDEIEAYKEEKGYA